MGFLLASKVVSAFEANAYNPMEYFKLFVVDFGPHLIYRVLV